MLYSQLLLQTVVICICLGLYFHYLTFINISWYWCKRAGESGCG